MFKRMFKKVQEGSRRFKNVQENVQEGSRRFKKVQECSIDVRMIVFCDLSEHKCNGVNHWNCP